MLTDRYVRREMGAVWTDEALFRSWMEVEVGPRRRGDGRRGRHPGRGGRLDPGTRRVRHRPDPGDRKDGPARCGRLHPVHAERVGSEGRWIHFGLTSSDVVDTALATRLVRSCDLLLDRVDDLRKVLRRRGGGTPAHPDGRPHPRVHAEPMTFGMKLALWWSEMGRNRRRLMTARETVGWAS